MPALNTAYERYHIYEIIFTHGLDIEQFLKQFYTLCGNLTTCFSN